MRIKVESSNYEQNKLKRLEDIFLDDVVNQQYIYSSKIKKNFSLLEKKTNIFEN